MIAAESLPVLSPGDDAFYFHSPRGGSLTMWAVRVEKVFKSLSGKIAVEIRHCRPGCNFPALVVDRRMLTTVNLFSGCDLVSGADEVPAGCSEKPAAPGVVPGRGSISRS